MNNQAPATPAEEALRILDQALGDALVFVRDRVGVSAHDACAVRWSDALKIIKQSLSAVDLDKEIADSHDDLVILQQENESLKEQLRNIIADDLGLVADSEGD